MKTYKSKVLLFGEYSVIQGHDALAIPVDLFSGQWAFDEQLAVSQKILYDFYAYLAACDFETVQFQAADFKQDLDRSLVFRSDIPIGYGVGSSGAVTAAVFDRYFQKAANLDLTNLKQILGKIESFFHGASSGLDPLVCYLDQAILIQGSNSQPIIPSKPASDFGLFLLDTGKPRRTAPLVEAYLEKQHSRPAFQQVVEHQIAPINHHLIQQYLSGDRAELWKYFDQISRLQWAHFQEMIPEHIHSVWQEGLAADQFRLKICGAGGGGFMLGMSAKAKASLPTTFKTYPL